MAKSKQRRIETPKLRRGGIENLPNLKLPTRHYTQATKFRRAIVLFFRLEITAVAKNSVQLHVQLQHRASFTEPPQGDNLATIRNKKEHTAFSTKPMVRNEMTSSRVVK